jgi:hypothetical protein
MTAKKITVKELIALLPTHIISDTADKTRVDYQVKKLTGEKIFQLMLLGILDSERISLRVMEDLYKSKQFQVYADLEEGETTSFTSLSDRLGAIKSSFFEQLFQASYEVLSRNFKPSQIKQYDILRFDATSMSAPAKLLSIGMKNGKPNKDGIHTLRQVKITVGFNGLIPKEVAFFKEQRYANDDLAIGEVLLANKVKEDEVIVFDRGVMKRTTFEGMEGQTKLFVTRINPTKNYKVVKTLHHVKGQKTPSLELISDEEVYLFHGHNSKKTKTTFRLIRAIRLEDGQELFFLSNITDLEAVDITDIYKRRWDIEVFFRFLKQELNLKHFISYKENGIKVMIYMTLIAAMLVLIYKKLNQIDGYKRAKRLFVEGLDTEIIRTIVILCGGDPDKSHHLRPT